MIHSTENKGIDRCESPLERELAMAFSRQARFEWRQPEAHHWEIGSWPSWFLALLAQPDYGTYRADFSICTWVHEGQDYPPFIVIVEVDGHDFHERTKEQAEYDKKRDRFMTGTGAQVFRFTGREISRDADACAYEVLEYVITIQREHLLKEFERFLEQRHGSVAKNINRTVLENALISDSELSLKPIKRRD